MQNMRSTVLAKVLAFILSISMMLGNFPNSVIYANAETPGMGTVTAFGSGEVNGDTVTFKNVSLNWVAKDPSIGRDVDGWWVGMKVNAPTDMTEEQLQGAKYINAAGVEKSFWTYKDSQEGDANHYIEMWNVLDEAKLNEAIANRTNIEYVCQFSWDGDDTYEQTFKMVVEPNSVVLKKEGVQVYPAVPDYATVELISGGLTVTDSDESNIVIENTETVELTWIEANNSIGRTEDGWWVGYKVVAPESVDMQDATYQHKTSDGWTEATLFADSRDSVDGDETQYIGVWRLINEEYINNAIANNKDINYITRYDWDGDQVYEQTIHLKVVPSKVVLKDQDGKQVYPEITKFATVNPITNGLTVTDTDQANIVIENTETVELTWIEANNSIGRTEDGWWAGYTVTAPEDVNMTLATYQHKTSDGWTEATLFADSRDSVDGDETQYIGVWRLINEEYINNAIANNKDINYITRYDWDGDQVYEQTIHLKIVPSKVVLKDQAGEQVYPEITKFATVNPITDGLTVTDTDQANIVIENSNTIELTWHAADKDAGRDNDGWWAGYNVLAPESLNLDLATYQHKTSDGWTTSIPFKANRDSVDGDETQYIGVWRLINEEYINNAIANNKDINYITRYDWDGDQVYEQTIHLKIVPSKVVLKDQAGEQVYPVIPKYATVDVISNGLTVTDSDSSYIVIENKDTCELTWSAKDTSIGRVEDGWWAGYKVVAHEKANIAEATYQHKTADGWTGPISFAGSRDSVDGDETQYIGVWRLINEAYIKNAIDNDKDINYITRYDWDGDQVYEQTIHLKFNPNKVVLKAQNGEQVYPYMGTVIPLTGGVVEGNTSNLTLTVNDASLTWSPADTSIGRHSDGWWVGMKVVAPDYDEEILKNATYKRRMTINAGAEWTDYTTVNFWSAKDSAADASSHYIEMWRLIKNEAELEAYKANGKQIVAEYVFNWDGVGEDDQTITMTIDPDGDIVLKKVTQTGFAFTDPNPVDKWVGENYTNTATGGQGSGSITYEIIEGAAVADIDAATGELTFKKIGAVTVKATKAADEVYDTATATYTVKAIKYSQSNFKFANSNSMIEVEYADGKYTNAASGGEGTGAVTYKVLSGSDVITINETSGEVTFLKAGEAMIEATKAADDNYNEITTTYILKVKTSVQEALRFDVVPTTVTYSEDAQSVLTVSGGSGEGKVTYSIVEGDEYATIDSATGKITTTKAGGSIKVQVNKAGDKGYQAATPLEATIVVEHAEQSGFEFTEKTPSDVTYDYHNNTFTNTVKGGNGTGAVTYTFADMESDEIADIDATTGKITILAAGTINVVATKAGDECYKSAQTTYQLKVNPATPDFNVENINLKYGTLSYPIVVDTITEGGTGEYLYEIVGVNDIGAAVDTNGNLTFTDSVGQVGTVTVRITKEADNRYSELSKEISVTVSYLDVSSAAKLTGDKKNESGWYTGIVTITAPDGYSISKNNQLSNTEWTDTLTCNTDGVNAVDYYLKHNQSKYISGKMTANDIKIDTASPANLSIAYDKSFVNKLIETITFGLVQGEELIVTLSATDETSGVDYLTCNIGGQDVVIKAVDFDSNQNGVATYSFTIPAEFKNSISFTATDVAGWTSAIKEDGRILVIDTVSPTLDVAYENVKKEHNGIAYSNGDVTVQFKITEENFLLRDADPVFKIDTTPVALTWTQEGEEWVAEHTLSNDNVYDLSLTFIDARGNAMADFSKTVVIDRALSEISIDYGTLVPVKDNIYNQARTATIEVVEANFDSVNVELIVEAKDITGNPVDISAKDYVAFAKDATNWKYKNAAGEYVDDANQAEDPEKHYLVLPTFDIDAIYSVDVKYIDLATNANDTYVADEFVIDKTDAENIQIEYSTPLIEKIIEAVTFGIYQSDKVVVTVTANDNISGVDYFDLTYNPVDGANNSNEDEFTLAKYDAVQDATDKSLFSVEFTVDADFRGTFTATAVDNAGNDSSKADVKVVVADTIAPGLAYEWTFTDDQMRDFGNVYYTKEESAIKFTVEEANFDLSLKTADDESVAPAPVMTVNGAAKDVSWIQTAGTDKWEANYQLTGNGDYVVELSYADRATNAMATYTQEVHIDNVAPEFEVTYDNNGYKNTNNYNADRTATIKVTEHNFRAEEVVLEVTAKDITGSAVDISSKVYAEYAKDAANWMYKNAAGEYVSNVMEAVNADEHYLVLPTFDIEAIYNVTLNYTDLAENVADEYTAEFVVDKTVADNIQIEYSTPLADKIIETVTFGIYKADEVVVTVTANDNISGVDYFNLKYNPVDGANTSNADQFTFDEYDAVQDAADKSLFSVEFTVDADFRGTFTATAVDNAGNDSSKDDVKVVVADTITPELAYEWNFTNDQVRDFEEIYYTKEASEIKYTIEEANFDLSLKVAGDETVAPAPVMTVNGEAKDITWTQIAGTDKWEADYLLTGNGDYMVELSYTDRSTNAMETFTQEVHIDNEAPVFEVTYDNNDYRNANNYKADRIATIKVTEHNFRAEEVELKVTAKDITGSAVDISSKAYAEYAKTASNWKYKNVAGEYVNYASQAANADEHYLVLPTFDIEAFYKVTLNYTDLAENRAAEYATEFVVDKTISSDVTIEYSASIIDKVIEAVAFGFYQPEVTIMVSAKDQTAGVESFNITYTQVDGQNNSNKVTYSTGELVALQDATDKTLFTATHVISAQARGKVSVDLIDKAGNTTGKAEEYVVVADTIAPGLAYEWKFTNDQVRDFEEIFYTKEESEIRYTIEEANFDLSLKAADDESVAPAPVMTVNGEAKDITWAQIAGTDKWETDYTLTGNGDYVVELSYTDRSTNAMETFTQEVHIDNVAPVLEVTYDNNDARNVNNYKADRTATVKVTEHNFRAEEVVLEVTAKDVTGSVVDISSKAYAEYAKDAANWKYKNAAGEYVRYASQAVNADEHYLVLPTFDIEAIYNVTLNYTDLAENVADEYATEFVVDKTVATDVAIAYSNSIVEKVIEAVTFGFYQPDVTVTLTANDITSGVDFFDWTYNKEANASAVNTEELQGKIETGDITYSADGLTATATFEILANARGYITSYVTDRAGNSTNTTDENKVTIVVDTINPEISVSYEADNPVNSKVQCVDDDLNTVESLDKAEAVGAYYNGDVTATIVIDEANFFEGVSAVDKATGESEVIHNVGIKLTKTDDDGNVTVTEYLPRGAKQLYTTDKTEYIAWTTQGDIHTFKINYTDNADYVLEMEYTDLSTNGADISANDGLSSSKTYKSKVVTIDKVDPGVPVVEVSYDNNDYRNTNNYKANRTATIEITEHNFRSSEVELVVTARDIQGNAVDISSKAYAEYAKDAANWKYKNAAGDLVNDASQAKDSNKHYLVLPTFDIEAIYDVTLNYTDLAKNEAEKNQELQNEKYAYATEFVVDKTVATNVAIAYSNSIVDKVIETVTFGFYQPDVTVTLTASDIISGVDFFDWEYTRESDASTVNTEKLQGKIETGDIIYSPDGLTATATFKIPANARGYITSYVTDRAGNSTNTTDENKVTIVVDTINPEISVSYEADDPVNTKVQCVDDDLNTVESLDKAEAVGAYYNGDVTATIVIEEANFFEGVSAVDKATGEPEVIHNVGIKLTKTDDDGNVTVTEYLPRGAKQLYTTDKTEYITWTTQGDIHTFKINYTDNADYVLEMEYTDLSTNGADISANDGLSSSKTYTSKVVTVDKILPEITVEYSNTDIIHTIGEEAEARDYFNAEQTATITVKEHNFRASDFAATVTAVNAANENVEVKVEVDTKDKVEDEVVILSNDIYKNEKYWIKSGNVYTFTIKYTDDANYTFDYKYKDLAENEATDYEEDKFTVDKTSPYNLVISYSQSILERVIGSITFNFYNGKVTAHISADDETAGIHRFVYSYLRASGVSSVNTELQNANIEEHGMSRDGKRSTARFEIPRDAVHGTTQFNGSVRFAAFDRSENRSEIFDGRRIVVDNIAPTATITYNEPVQQANDISYYAGNIDARIVINEANFYSEDVIVRVNDQPIAVHWMDDSVDVHTGTFTLTEDNDYIVTVEYVDRSQNRMTTYTSNRLTIDTKAPTLTVSNVEHNSANKDEPYRFTITANDTNMDPSSIDVVLMAVVRNDDGSYSTKQISLGGVATVEAGKTYSYTVNNLVEDGIYTLTCTSKDMSGNVYSKIGLSDGREYDEVRFSINREGSAFGVNGFTDALVQNYYVYSVDEDVVIEEVNTDPIENYVVKLNGEVLTEEEDYTTTITNNRGEWSRRTYAIHKDLFEAEGEYNIIVESVDKTETTAYSDVKNLRVSFVVDQTAPVLTIGGLEEGGRYQVEEQTVSVIPTDDGGRLNSMRVIILDSDGKPLKDADGKDISVRFDMSGEELLAHIRENNGTITFTVPEGLEHQVRIICNDCAVNADGQTNEFNELYTKVTVSQSSWIIFYANKPLFYGSIAGVLLLTAGIAFLVWFRKRREAIDK
ncbi:MAG: hypothetical protein IJB84_07660 [Lachnospiraceae bacterium]|nr:hypothetical protein [Lachnospiraceae bacterium]